jgi:5-(carboxyamino)imidazole ribonucleotide synthase
MTNVLGGPEDAERSDLNRRLALVMRRWPAVKVHLYGKEWRPGRKVGHVTALGDDLDEVRAVSSAAADLLSLGDTKGTT